MVWDSPQNCALNNIATTLFNAEFDRLQISTYQLRRSPSTEEGQFLLIRLPEGGTRLQGTTWYHNELLPLAIGGWVLTSSIESMCAFYVTSRLV